MKSRLASAVPKEVPNLSALSIEQLTSEITAQPRSAMAIAEELYGRYRQNAVYLRSPWTTEAVRNLGEMVKDLQPVLDDWRNATWVRRHAGLRSLVALAIMVTEKAEMLDGRRDAGWISDEYVANRRRRDHDTKMRVGRQMRRFARI